MDLKPKIQVVNKHYHKPTEWDYYIGRPSPLGNPYSHLPNTIAKFCVNSRKGAVKKYSEWFNEQLEKIPMDPDFRTSLLVIEHIIKEYGQINLVCWCAPHACHGDILKEFLENE